MPGFKPRSSRFTLRCITTQAAATTKGTKKVCLVKAKKTKFISFLGERENKILVHFLGKKETEKPGNQFNKILQIHYYKISWPFEIYFLM